MERRWSGIVAAIAFVVLVGAAALDSRATDGGEGEVDEVTTDVDGGLAFDVGGGVAGPAQVVPRTPGGAFGAPTDGKDALGLPVLVEPAEGLAEGDVVSVSGSGFPPATVLGVVHCAQAARYGGGVEHCDIRDSTQVTTDATGDFSVTTRIRRYINTPSEGEVDCASAPAACAIAAGAINDFDQSGAADIALDPNGPSRPAPVLTATPATGLVDRQIVRVTVTGATRAPDAGVTPLQQCAARPDGRADTSRCDEWWSDPVGETDGASEVFEHRVYRVIETPQGPVDCATAPGGCVLARDASRGDRAAAVAVAFDPAAPAGPPPAITVEPATGLDDRATVTVVGTGFRPDGFIEVAQCASEVEGADQGAWWSWCGQVVQEDDGGWFGIGGGQETSSSMTSVQADAEGRFTLQLDVGRSLRVAMDGSTVDCGSQRGRCVVATLSGPRSGPTVGLTFGG
jgi:hypothetical protein